MRLGFGFVLEVDLDIDFKHLQVIKHFVNSEVWNGPVFFWFNLDVIGSKIFIVV
jgi:hypothetical protein